MGDRMKRFIEGEDRKRVTLLPECLDDFVAEDNPVRIIEAFVEELDLASMGFDGAMPSITGRPSYHPGVLLKIYIYGLPESGPVAFKHWMSYTHFLMRRLPNVGTEMSLNALAYYLARVLRILGFKKTMKAMRQMGV